MGNKGKLISHENQIKGVTISVRGSEENPYLIFVIFFTESKFLENKIYTQTRQFFALNLLKTPLFRVKSVENANFPL